MVPPQLSTKEQTATTNKHTMSNESQLEEHGGSQLESQSSSSNGLDVTASMMIPATTRLLADMNLSRIAVASKAGTNNSHNTSNNNNSISAVRGNYDVVHVYFDK